MSLEMETNLADTYKKIEQNNLVQKNFQNEISNLDMKILVFPPLRILIDFAFKSMESKGQCNYTGNKKLLD